MTEHEGIMNHSKKLSAILVASLIVMAFIVTCSPLGVASVITGTTRTVGGCQTVTTTSSGTTTITTTKVVCRTYTGQFIIGYIGCSDTWMTIDGYYQQPNNIGLFWAVDQAIDGGGITSSLWANASSHYWATYDSEVSLYGQPKAVWVEDCGSYSGSLGWSDMQQFFAILKQHSPSAVVYISPISDFVPNGLCDKEGTTGVQNTTDIVNLAIANGYALAGPIMGPLNMSTTLVDSRCHPNEAGELLLGSQLVQFFDGLGSSSSSTSSNTWRPYVAPGAAAIVILAVAALAVWVKRQKTAVGGTSRDRNSRAGLVDVLILP